MADQREALYDAGKWPKRMTADDWRSQAQAAMDAPMTDLEAVQTVVAMFEVMAKRIKIAGQPEQLEILPLIVRAGEVIEHLQQRLEIAA